MKIRVPLLFPKPNMNNTDYKNYYTAKPMMRFKDGDASELRHREWVTYCRTEKAKGK